MDTQEEIVREIAKVGLELKAVKLNPDNPFTWASGFRMPVYNDNRLFLFNADHRNLISAGFLSLIRVNGVSFYGIAGTSTSGISPATTLADKVGCPLIYIREKPKEHGLRNQIEGIDAESDLDGRKFVLIEDLISTGGSSAKAVQSIRSANGVCDLCLSIFTYGLDKAARIFRGEEAFDREGNKLLFPCKVKSILTYDRLIELAKESGYINSDQTAMLEEWRSDPFGWGERHGFPRVERS